MKNSKKVTVICLLSLFPIFICFILATLLEFLYCLFIYGFGIVAIILITIAAIYANWELAGTSGREAMGTPETLSMGAIFLLFTPILFIIYNLNPINILIVIFLSLSIALLFYGIIIYKVPKYPKEI